MPTTARGQISFIDMNDGKTIALTLKSNQGLTHVHNKEAAIASEKYVPNYEVSPYLVITPYLFVSDVLTNEIRNIVDIPYWTINGVPVNQYGDRDTRAQTGGVDNFWDAEHNVYLVDFGTTRPNYNLVIKSNELFSAGQMTIDCDVVYHDNSMGYDTRITGTITFQEFEASQNMFVATIYAIEGDTLFYNKETTPNQHTVIHCDVYRGGTRTEDDNTDIEYAWFRKDNPDDTTDDFDWYKIFDTQAHAEADPDYHTRTIGGQTQEYITDSVLGEVGIYVYTTGSKPNTISINLSAQTNPGDELTVTPDAVDNYDSFMCIVKDVDSTSSTFGHRATSLPMSILDYGDPYIVNIYAEAGNYITRDTTSIDAYVVITRDGAEIPTTMYNAATFIWVKRLKNGALATGLINDTTNPAYWTDHKFTMSGTNLVPDEGTGRWARQHLPGESIDTYSLIALGSNNGGQLTVYKDEVAVKATFDVTVLIP